MPLEPTAKEEAKSPSELCRRLGRFYITHDLLKQEPEAIREHVLAKMVIVRAELLWERNAIEYVAMSELFDLLPWYHTAPEYGIVMSKTADGQIELLKVERFHP